MHIYYMVRSMRLSVLLARKWGRTSKCVCQWRRRREYKDMNICLGWMYKVTCWRQIDLRPHTTRVDLTFPETFPISDQRVWRPTGIVAEDDYFGLESASFQKEQLFLNVPFMVEEVECTLLKIMKMKKASGPDDLITEHLHYGGSTIIVWLTVILNSIIELEQIPATLKQDPNYNPCVQGRRERSSGCQQLPQYYT